MLCAQALLAGFIEPLGWGACNINILRFVGKSAGGRESFIYYS
jgi:hypothetical protein